MACQKGQPKDPELCALFAACSPGGDAANVTVPLMEHETDGQMFRMIESGPCSEYVNDAFPDRFPLWPSDPKQRFAVRMFLDTAGNAGFMGAMFWTAENGAEKIAEHVPKLQLVNACLEKYSTPDGDFLLDQISMAEVMVAPLLQRWKIIGELKGFNGMQLAKDLGLERFYRWADAVVNHAAVSSTFPEEFVEVLRANEFSGFDCKPFKISYEVVEGNVANVKAEPA